jgi:hypothetical protein
MNYKTFIQKKDFLPTVQLLSEKLLAEIKSSNRIMDSRLFPIEKGSYHFITKFLEPHTKLEKNIFSWLMRTANKSEDFAANSSYYSTICFFVLLNEWIKYSFDSLQNESQEETLEKFKKAIEEFKKILEDNSKVTKEEEIPKLLKQILNDECLETVVSEALELAGLQGFISIEEGFSDAYSVEMRTGYNFPLPVSKGFLNGNSWEYSEVKVLVVDGVVEKVSELDKILQKNNQTLTPTLFFAQGFSEEVLATLKVNFDKKRLNIVPVKAPPDVETLNLLNDIAIVSGAQTVSTLKGDLLIYVDYDSLPIVESVKCTTEGVLIRNSKTSGAVGNQVRNILEKREQKQREAIDLAALYENRVKNLISHSVIVKLPKMTKPELESTKTKIDICLRTFKANLNYGTIDFNEINEKLKTINSQKKDDMFFSGFKKCVEVLKENSSGNSSEASLLSVYLGIYFAGLNATQVLASSGIVI